MADLVYAASVRRQRGGEPQSFATEADRERLSPAAMIGFRAAVEFWRLNSAEAAALLGVSDRTWDRMKKPDWRGALHQDQLTRVSAVLGVYKGLHLLFADGLADRWPKLANNGPLFEGRTPVEAMMRGGIPAHAGGSPPRRRASRRTVAVLDGVRTTRLAVERTVRLVASARLRPPVLGSLAPEALVADLEEIEGATSGRLNGQWRGADGIDASEFVYGAPCATFINAAFAYPKPGRLNRFNGDARGAWYAAMEVETSLAEVAFHISQELANIGVFQTRVEFAELHASFAGDAIDLLATPLHPALDPDPALGYPAGNALASAALAAGVQIIRYPSVRRRGGVCFAALAPHAVQSVQQGGLWEIAWEGQAAPVIRKVRTG